MRYRLCHPTGSAQENRVGNCFSRLFPALLKLKEWIPACAGMTGNKKAPVRELFICRERQGLFLDA